MTSTQPDDSWLDTLSSAESLVTAGAALGSLIVALLAAAYAVREHRHSRETLVHDMRERWSALQPAWAQILLAQYGPDWHYVDATPDVRAKAARLHSALREEGLSPAYDAALELRASVRPIARFLSYAADSVLRGRWRMSEAYEVLGPDVARHHKTLRLIAHRAEGEGEGWLIQSTEFNNFDEQDAILLFAFLVRAEQCRRGDTYAHFAVELAEEMRGPFRRPLRASARRAARVRHRATLPWRVRALLWRGRHPRLAAAYQVPAEPIIAGTQRRYFRRPLEPMLLVRLRIFLARRASQ